MRLHRHFVPHTYPPVKPGNRYHRAHLISNKSLFVYFQILLIFGVFTFVLKTKSGQILSALTFSSQEIIQLSNQERQKSGLSPLLENSKLTQAAEAKAADMFAYDYWAHYSPIGKSPWVFINAVDYKYVYAGENLARDFEDAGEVVRAWMNSPSHRANLLDRNFKEIGVAVVDGKLGGRDGILVVQMFGSTTAAEAAETIANNQENLVQRSVQGEQAPVQPVVSQSSNLTPARFDVTKGITLGIVSFIFLLFLIEAIFSLRSAHMKLKPEVIAHLLLLGLSIMALWYSASGAIL